MDNEKTYGIMLEHLIQFHKRYFPGTTITVQKRHYFIKMNGKHVPDDYRLEVTYPLRNPDIANTSYNELAKHAFNADTMKELYQSFTVFRHESHFFRKDSSLEEIRLQLALRNIDG